MAEIRSDLECKVCFERFSSQQSGRRPRNLPCGHVICLGCVCALAQPISHQLECPFCRQMCDVGGTYDCRALLDLQDLLDSAAPPRCPLNIFASGTSCSDLMGGQCKAEGLTSGLLRICTTFGGWGTIINPTGVAVLGPSVRLVVVHGGHEKVTIFSSQGHYVHSFARYGHGRSELCHPLGVGASPSGHIVVADAGDSSVKVFSSRGYLLETITGPFELPWGVDVDDCGNILVTDAQAGTLWQVVMDFRSNVVVTKVLVLRDLQCPRAVASCRVSGRIAVLEHLEVQRSPSGDSIPTRLKLFTKAFGFLVQVDSFSLNLMNSLKLDISCVTFDRRGDVIVADTRQGMIWSLGDLQETPLLFPLVKDGLVHPVGLLATEHSLIVLDSGDHTVKIYSTTADELRNAKSSKSV